MNALYDEINLEKHLRVTFDLQVNIKSTIANKIPVGPSSIATIFLSDRGILYAYITANGGQTLGDVKKILSRMNLRADTFLPPHGEKDYFNRIASAKFMETFPGRQNPKDSDLIFYKTLVPYNPALIQIAEIEKGVIKQYDADTVGKWRNSIKLVYRRITTI